jgi:hypothetical protein
MATVRDALTENGDVSSSSISSRGVGGIDPLEDGVERNFDGGLKYNLKRAIDI